MTTIREIADAIEKNGLERTEGAWFRDELGQDLGMRIVYAIDKEYIKQACAVGMAAYNLNIPVSQFKNIRSPGLIPYAYYYIASLIEMWNDGEHLDFVAIANRLREVFSEFLDIPLKEEK